MNEWLLIVWMALNPARAPIVAGVYETHDSCVAAAQEYLVHYDAACIPNLPLLEWRER